MEKAKNKKRSRLEADHVILIDNSKEAGRQGLFSFHFFIKENDLGAAEKRSNTVKTFPREAKRKQGDAMV